MADRMEISDGGAQELRTKSQVPPRTPEDKLQDRENRTEWADKGHLPEGYSNEEIEQRLLGKLAALESKKRLHEVRPEEIYEMLEIVNSLRVAKRISEVIHLEAMAVLCGAPSQYSRSGLDCDID